MGATWDGTGVNFAIFSRHATRVDLCLFMENGEEARLELPSRTDDIWHGYLSDVGPGQLYGYRVHGPQAPERGHWFNPAKLLIDPYAKGVVGRPNWSGPLWYYKNGFTGCQRAICHEDSAAAMPKCQVIDLNAPSQGHDRPNTAWSDTVIYEAHARGLTMLHPDVPEDKRGRISCLAEPVILAHLKRLGVTAIELLPIQAALDEPHLVRQRLSNYWRYNTIAFFAAETRYTRGAGLTEVQDTVRRLHDAGLEVIMDVAFNHTAEGDHLGPMLSLKGIDNASYYHLHPSNPARYENYSGCGNALNLDHPRVLQMVLDSLRFWAGTIGVDGFRFDLASTLARRADGFDRNSHFFGAIRQDPILRHLKMIAEPWDVGLGGYQLGQFPSFFSEWNDRYRDTIRQFWRGDEAMLPDLATRLLGSSDVFPADDRPLRASVNFVTAHDGFVMQDLVSFEAKHNEANGEANRDGHNANFSRNYGAEGPTSDPTILARRAQQKRNLMATLLLSRGTPMILAGDELGNCQYGNNNAYCQDNEIGWVDWSVEADDKKFLNFVAWLIKFRACNPVLKEINRRYRGADEAVPVDVENAVWLCPNGEAMSDAHWQVPWARAIGLLLRDDHGGTDWFQTETFAGKALLIAINGSDDDLPFTAPSAPGIDRWMLQIDTSLSTGRPDKPTYLEPGGSFTLPASSLRVFASDVFRHRHIERIGRMSDDLDSLAAFHGIESSYHDALGGRHLVSEQTKKALLAAMGVNASTDTDIEDSLHDGQRKLCERMVRPVNVVRYNVGCQIEITLPTEVASKRYRWSIRTEFGDDYGGEGHLGDVLSGHDRLVDGRHWRTFLLDIDLGLPAGYHQFVFDVADRFHAESAIIVSPGRAFCLDDLSAPNRLWGILAPLYGLRCNKEEKAIGDLVDLKQLVGCMASEGASFIGVNPITSLNPALPHQASPYSPSSRLHLNELLVGLEGRDRLGAAEDVASVDDLVDYQNVGPSKLQELHRQFRRIMAGGGALPRDFDVFCAERGQALERFAVFRVLFEHFFRNDPAHCWTWRHWPSSFRDPLHRDVMAFAAEHRERIEFFKYIQWVANKQVSQAQVKAIDNGMPIGLYLDLAVGADPHGADCWADADVFATHASLGAPPDDFNSDGQNWSLAPFRPRALEDRAYRPFIDVLRSTMRHAGAIRIDHVIGLQRSFWIPDDHKLGGAYVRYPVDDLLGIVALESQRHRCLVIGEDLGNLPQGLRERLDRHRIVKSSVMYFERDQSGGFRGCGDYPDNALATVGTHDLPTLSGYFQSHDIDVRAGLGLLAYDDRLAMLEARRRDLRALLQRLSDEGFLPPDIDPDDPPQTPSPALLAAVHAFLARTPAQLMAVQLEDALGQREQANLPGTVDEHPNWRRRMHRRIDDIGSHPAAREIFDAVSKLRPSLRRRS